MPTRVYEPPVDPSSVDIETEDYGQGRRQVMRAPQTEAAVSAAQTGIQNAILTAQTAITKTGNNTKSLADIHTTLTTNVPVTASLPDGITLGTITTADTSGGGNAPTAGSFVRHTEAGGDSSFSCSVQGATGNYSFVFERSINFGTVSAPQEVWTAVGAFQAGTPWIKSTWTQADAARAPLEFHGNLSSSSRLRVRFTQLGTSNPTVVIRSSAGTGTITVGNPMRIADATTPSQQLAVNPSGSARVTMVDGLLGISTLAVDQQAALMTRMGKAYVAGSGQQTTGGIGTTTMRGLLRNPTGSGKTIYVYCLESWSSGQTGYGSLLINPTGSLPTTAKTVNNTYVGYPNSPAAQVFFDTGAAMTGGTDSGLTVPIPAGVINKVCLDAPFVLSPGVQLGLQAPFGGGTTAVITLYFWEE